jgi:hypothetical protein
VAQDKVAPFLRGLDCGLSAYSPAGQFGALCGVNNRSGVGVVEAYDRGATP